MAKRSRGKASQAVPRSRPTILETARNPWVPVSLLAVLLAVFIFWVRRIGDFGVETDFYGTYAPGAQDIVRGHFDLKRFGVTGPLYEWLLALGVWARIPVFAWAKILSALSMVGTLILWIRIAQQTLGKRVAAWTPWLLLLSPTFVRFGYIASSDAIYCFLFSLSIFALTRAETGRASFNAGLVALMAFLARYQALIFPGFGFLWHVGKPRALRLWSWYLIAFPGVAVAGLLVMSMAGVSLPKPDFLYNIHYEVAEGHIDWDDYQAKLSDRGNPWDVLVHAPASVLLVSLRNAPSHLENELVHGAGPVLSLLVVLGAIGLIRRGSRKGIALRFAACWLLQFLFLLPTQTSERYALTQIPLLAVISAWGLDSLPQRLSLRRLGWVVSGLIAAGLIMNAVDQTKYQRRQPRFLLETARQIKSLVRPGDRMLARKPHLPFLVGCQWVYFPDAGDLRELRAALIQKPAEFVYYGRSEVVLRPNFRFLSFPPYRPTGWETAHSDPDGELYRVGKVFFASDIPADDAVLRELENATFTGSDLPIAEARRLAAFLVQSGRCTQALSEYERIQKFSPLTPEEEQNVAFCRGAMRDTVQGR